MLTNELLGYCAFVNQVRIVCCFQDVPVQSGNAVHQSDVEKQEFVGLLFEVRLQRQAGAVAVDDFGNDTRHAEQLNVPSQSSAVIVLRDMFIFDFAADI